MNDNSNPIRWFRIDIRNFPQVDKCTRRVPTDTYGEIEFADDKSNRKPYIRVEHETDAVLLLKLMRKVWGLDVPNLVISVTGGAQDFKLKPRMREVFAKGLIKVNFVIFLFVPSQLSVVIRLSLNFARISFIRGWAPTQLRTFFCTSHFSPENFWTHLKFAEYVSDPLRNFVFYYTITPVPLLTKFERVWNKLQTHLNLLQEHCR